MAEITVGVPNTAFVSGAYPGLNFAVYPFISVGYDPVYGPCAGYLQIELPLLPVTSVDSAVLRLTVLTKAGSGPGTVIVGENLTPLSTNTVTYQTQPYDTPVSTFGVEASDLYRQIDIDITDIIRHWLGGSPNNGISLKIPGPDFVRFANANIVYEPYFPTLELSYSAVEPDEYAENFAGHQLAHVIEQLITRYPKAEALVIMSRLPPDDTFTGTMTELFKAADGTYGGLLMLDTGNGTTAIPLSSIAAIELSYPAKYDPLITYLEAPHSATGCGWNVLAAARRYFADKTRVGLDLQTVSMLYGSIYKNEDGMLVLADPDLTWPTFIPVTHIVAAYPFTFGGDRKTTAAKKHKWRFW